MPPVPAEPAPPAPPSPTEGTPPPAPQPSPTTSPLPGSQAQPPPSPPDPGDEIVGAEDDGGRGASWEEDPPPNQGILGAVGSYVSQAAKQALLGNFTDPKEKNALGTVAEVGTGFVPVVGTIASGRDLTHDLTHWKWSWGHALQTGADTLGLIPFARGLLKGSKAVQGASEGLQAAAKAEGAALKAAKNLDEAAPLANNAVAQGATRKTGKRILCFPPGTLVLMDDGTAKPIDEIQVGDAVVSFDPEGSDPPSAEPICAVLRNHTYTMIHVSFDANGDGTSEGMLKATREHPIWTQNRGWQKAVDLKGGDDLQDHEGKPIRVLSVWVEETDTETFNLSLPHHHAFFVVVNGTTILVHNTDPWDIIFSHPLTPDRLEQLTHGPWAGHTLDEAIAEARRLGRLPEGLAIEAQEVVLANGDRKLVAVNNRTLYIAREANLHDVPTFDRGGETFHKLQRNFRESGLGGPLETAC
jgi:hypothetical protein